MRGIMNRKQRIIDGISTLDSFDDPSVTQIIVFIHGIFGSSEETWKTTPPQLMTSPQFLKFDYGSYGYASQIIEWKRPETFVQQLVLWMRTHLSAYNEIFLVCHSMGGLFARHAIISMLEDKNDHQIVSAIRRCFMIASPITGSTWARWIAKIPGLSKINSRVAYLADPKINNIDMSAAYKAAAQSFVDAGGRPADVPRFSYFVGMQDNFVTAPETLFYTDFDKFEGTVSGNHSSIKEDLNANSTLLTRIAQLIQDSSLKSESSQRTRIEMVKEATRKREQATQDTARGVHVQSQDQRRPVNVLVISCSATKSDVHGTGHSRNDWIVDQITDERLASIILEMRSRVLRLIQEGKIDGIEFKEGNRAAKPANQQLLYGPDLGGVFNEERYLPAYLRYKGRCYQATKEEWEALYENPAHPQILIMSGLYGLIPATESIQNYDVHLTDVDLTSSISLQSYWKDRELMTQILVANLEWVEKHRGPVGRVVDALSELSYQETINWSLIDRRWPVLHRVFESKSGRDALGNLGVWVRDVIRRPEIIGELNFEQFYDNPNFLPKDRIAFEERIGGSQLPVAREVNQSE
jgi:pimeloyl-ACP methyl ester carboxylesterase